MTKFSDLKLDPKVLKAVVEAGYETPTPIQAGAIPHALEGRDVLGIAQTGTGKTASFTLPMITLLGRGRARARMPRSLVLCPTRELAAQVAENFDTYAKHTKLTKALLIGGVSFSEQDKLIDRGVDVLIATPGRLLDHFERGKLLLTGVQIMVVDEADRMLDMGFIPDIERIFQLTPFTRQTLFFSATMAPEIERITNTFLHSPERIEVARQATTGENITQRLVEITPTRRDQTSKQKRELLRAIIDAEGEALKNAIIFCNRKTDVDIVAKSLKKHGYDAAPIHGDLDQSQRMRTLDEFRDGKLRFLIASDVAARGLDIPAVSHVINFDLPSHAEDYVHRIGRTGRAGRTGTAISLGTPSDEKYLSGIENLVKHALPRGEVPEGFALSEASHSAPRNDRGERGERGGERRGERGGRNGRGRDRGGDRDRNAERGGERGEERARDEVRTEVQPQPAPREPERSAPRAESPRERSESSRGEPRQDRGDSPRNEPRQDRGFDGNRGNRREGGRDGNRDGGREFNRDRDRDGNRDGHRDGNRDRRRDHDRGGEVMGLGIHVPEFMLQSFRPAEFPPETSVEVVTEVVAEPVRVPVQVVNEVVVTEGAEPAAKPKRNRRKKSDNAAAPVEAAVVAETAPVAEIAADVPVETPKKPTRSRRKPAGTEAEAAAPEAAADTAEKPKRTRRKKVETAAEAPADAATEAAPKPKRVRRKKTDDTPAETA